MLDEQISALLDGELAPEERARALERIKRDPKLRAVWSRQHLLRAAFRNQFTGAADPGFADRLMTRLQAEAVPSKVVDLTARLRPAAAVAPAAVAAPRSLRRWGVGFALAASVALALVAVSWLSPVGTDATTMKVADNASWSRVNEETARELDDYLLDHHNAAASYGFAATSGYARLAAPSSQYVAYDPNK